MKRWTLLFVSCMAATLAESATQEPKWGVDYDVEEGTIFIATSSMYQRTAKQETAPRKVRTLLSYKALQRDGAGVRYRSVLSEDYMSCGDYTKTAIKRTLYEGSNGSGKIVATYIASKAAPIRILPGSTDELVIGEANCSLLSRKWATEAG